MKIAIRGWGNGKRIFNEIVEGERDAIVDNLAFQYIVRLLHYPSHMIEFEFLDDPDLSTRFLRIGTDPTRMVRPIRMGP